MCLARPEGYWMPQTSPLLESNATADITYFFSLHQYTTSVSGNHYKDNACFMSRSKTACTLDMTIFSIHSADSFLFLWGDGYLGLGNGAGWGSSDGDAPLNALDQMVQHKMISKKQFGV